MLRIPDGDLAARSIDPFFTEELGASEAPIVVVDLTGCELTASTIAALRSLAAVVIAVGDRRPSAESCAGFDLFLSDVASLGDEADLLAQLDERVTAAPIAALTLAQLSRLTERATIADALVAESLAYTTLQTGPTFTAWLAGRSNDPALAAPHADDVLTDRVGDTLHVTLNRPERHNAFSAGVRDGLVEACRVVAADETIETMVVSGAGPSFCSGGDLDEFGSVPSPAVGHQVRSTRSAGGWIARLADRTEFVLHGACYGAGIEVPAFSASVAAHDGTAFCLPEIGFGLVPGAGGTVSIPRRVGRSRFLWLALSGQVIDIDTAHSWNLIDRVIR